MLDGPTKKRAEDEVYGEPGQSSAIGAPPVSPLAAEPAVRDTWFNLLSSRFPALFWTTDSDFELTSCLGPGLDSLNMEPNGPVGFSVAEFFRTDPTDGELLDAHHKALTGKTVNCTSHLAGNWYFNSVGPLRDQSGRIIGTAGFGFNATDQIRAELTIQKAYRDLERRVEERTASLSAANSKLKEEILDRQQAEIKLISSEKKYRELVEGLHDAIFRFALPEGRIVYMSGAARRVFGYPSGQFVKDHTLLRSIVDENHRERFSAAWQSFLDGDVRGTTEYVVRDPEGNKRWILQSNRGVFDASGRIIALEAIARDVTEQKEAEAKALQLQTELAQLSRLSTMGEMASGIAHELNQPLTAIINYTRGCAGRLRNGETANEHILYGLDRAAEQAERAGAIIRRLRNFVHQKEPQRTQVNLNELVKEMLDLSQQDIRLGRVTAILDLDQDLTDIASDRVQIQQVILNLIRNAVEAMQEAGSAVRTLTIRTSRENDDFAIVSVADSGPGIPADIAGRIFDPFFTTKAEGMGMGLSVSRSIIEAHGGRFQVQSGDEGGATIQFNLPIEGGV